MVIRLKKPPAECESIQSSKLEMGSPQIQGTNVSISIKTRQHRWKYTSESTIS